MQAVRLFTTVSEAIAQALPELLPLRGRRVEMLVLDEAEPTRVPATAPWGFLQGKIRLRDDFDDPLPEEMQRAFDGEGS
jgi:hypothetical protein